MALVLGDKLADGVELHAARSRRLPAQVASAATLSEPRRDFDPWNLQLLAMVLLPFGIEARSHLDA